MLVDWLDREFYEQKRGDTRVYPFGYFTGEQNPYFIAPVTFLVEIGPPAVPAVGPCPRIRWAASNAAPAHYRQHLAAVLAGRALAKAFSRLNGN